MFIGKIHNGVFGGHAELYQGTAAIASWLSSLAAAPTSAHAPAPVKTTAATPHVSSGYGQTSYDRFRSTVGAATAAQGQGTASPTPPADGQGTADYDQAVTAYGSS